jgi:hypothetical protein
MSKTLLAANARQMDHIAELEAELAKRDRYKNLAAARARIAELEAEVAALRFYGDECFSLGRRKPWADTIAAAGAKRTKRTK